MELEDLIQAKPWDGRDTDGTLADRIAYTLAERIISGAIGPGARLRQDHIATEFKASHVPVREAFRRLEAQGLVQSEPRRGVRVPALDPDAVLEVTEMRAALETLALRHALDRIGPDDLGAARAAIEAGEASRDIRIWEATNRRFHRVLIAPCGMPRLLASIDDLHRASARFLFATWRDLDWQPRSDHEHRIYLDAVERRAAVEACRLLEGHIRDAGHALVRQLRSLS
ncbi:GntR family transcriptional regulator [Reyranella sp. CPCC 100927]|uniref:GntR family transcriptional regulator n=1 Tax=Reyranella sp. CPCC 100927 TaxID=2599616 RepID=UPI0011B4EFEF|nr:GntR family transcriptional regulator [Reyranella sp. CPCC 100927]TWT11839.1 GntR family transcriptional regulator [Reyranella sp. CPCC 100927]